MFSKAVLWEGDHWKSASFFNRLLRGSDSRQIWDERGHVTCYTKEGLKFLGVLWLLNGLNGFHLFWVRMYPSASDNILKNVIFVSLILHLSRLRTSPCCPATSIRWCKLASCCSSVGPCTAMSLAMPTVPGHFSRIKLKNILTDTQSEG